MVKSQTREVAWRPLGKSVKGASHIRLGKPNQDAILWFPESVGRLPVILAIADGHGSDRSSRSHEGSRLAAETAVGVLKEYFYKTETLDAAQTRDVAYTKLPKILEQRWKDSVDEHIRNNPLVPSAPSGHSNQEAALPLSDRDRFHIYGSTLIAVMIAETHILYLQLGDGDILTVSPDGDVSRPLPDDDRLLANETTSLCLPNAGDYFRIRLQMLSESPPALVLLATDGYLNSFKSKPDFLKAGMDFSKIVRSEGLDYVNRNLGKWLSETSQEGSGDDITVGLIENLSIRGIDSLLWQNSKYEKRIGALELFKEEQLRALAEASATVGGLEKTVSMLSGRLRWSYVLMLLLLLVCAGLVVNTLLGSGRQMNIAHETKLGNGPQGKDPSPAHGEGRQFKNQKRISEGWDGM